MVASIERVGHLLLDAVQGPSANAEIYKARHAPFTEAFSSMLGHYESELYQDRYRPAFQRAQALEDRKKKFEELQRQEREAKALERVRSFSEDDSKPKK